MRRGTAHTVAAAPQARIPSLLLLPGSYDLSCCTWRPVASAAQEFSAFFLGGHPSLKTTAVLGGGSGGGAAAERFRLMTTAAGTVHVRVDVLVRHMEAYGVEW